MPEMKIYSSLLGKKESSEPAGIFSRLFTVMLSISLQFAVQSTKMWGVKLYGP